MTFTSRAIATCLALVIAGGSAPTAQAQSIDSLTALLSSRSIGERASAVVRLGTLPASSLPAATRTIAIDLLEREATGKNAANDSTGGPNDETWSEYIGDLAALVLEFNDPRSLRGQAFIGIQTSFAISRWVASLGAPAIPVLDEVWSTSASGRGAVVSTWGLMLAPSSRLDNASAVAIRSRLLAPDDTFPIQFADAVENGQVVALVPLVDSLAATAPNDIVATNMREISAKLTPRYKAQTPSQTARDLDDWIAGVCAQSSVDRGYCAAASAHIRNVTRQIDAGAYAGARTTLGVLIDLTMQQASRSLGMLDTEMIVSGAERLMAKLR